MNSYDCPVCRFEVYSLVGHCHVCGYNPSETDATAPKTMQYTPSISSESVPVVKTVKLTWRDWCIVGLCGIVMLAGLRLGLSIDFERSDAGQFADAYLHGVLTPNPLQGNNADFLNN